MRNQFFTALQVRCLQRSTANSNVSNIRYWFSPLRLKARRMGAEFTDEGTRPFGVEAHQTTAEDPPLSVELWGRLSVG